MPTGVKYWQLKYRYHNKEKLLSFGVYPEVTLAEAREKRDAARKLLAGGVDPSLEKKRDQKLARLSAENTFEVIAREWHALQKERWTPRHAESVMKRLQADIFSEIGTYPIKEITPPLMLETIRKIEKRGAFEIAHRAVQVCRQVFRYAIVTGRGTCNPAADLKGALKPVKHGHFAALDAKQLPQFLYTLEHNDARLYAQTRYVIRLLMLTLRVLTERYS
jgi:integrase